MRKQKIIPYSLPAIDLSCAEGFVRAGLSSRCIENTFFNRITQHLDTQVTYLLIIVFPLSYLFLWYMIFRHEPGSKIISASLCFIISLFPLLIIFALFYLLGSDFSL